MKDNVKKITKEYISELDIKKAEYCLTDNGVSKDDVEVVLQALGYILLDMELYK